MSFRDEGDLVVLLGHAGDDLAAANTWRSVHGRVAGKPSIDIDFEKRLQECVLAAIGEGW